MTRSFVWSALLLLAVPAHAKAQQEAWSVEEPTGPSEPIAFTADEGTWMSVDVSPDGSHIAFDLLGTIYEMPYAGGAATALTSGRSWNLFPRYSPDGERIAFSSDRGGSHGIWTLERRSGTVRAVSDAPDLNLYRPTWTVDGDAVLAGASGDGVRPHLVRLGPDGSAPGPYGQGPVNGALPIPGSGTVVYEHHAAATWPFGFNPYVVPAGGARIDILRPGEEPGVFLERPGGAFQPTPSPDGRSLAYLNRSLEGTRLIVQNLATRAERVLVEALDRDRQDSRSAYGPHPNLAWHPDGDEIVIAWGGRIRAVDVATGRDRVIPFEAPVERAASSTIRHAKTLDTGTARTRTHRWGLRSSGGVISEALGDLWLHGEGPPENITSSPSLETSPIVDPLTGDLYFASWTDRDLGRVVRMTAAGSVETVTTIPSQYGSVAVHPGGELVAYARGTGGLQRGEWLSNQSRFELIVHRRGAGERRITEIQGQALEYANIAGKIPPRIQFGPEGRTLYYTEFVRDTLSLKQIGIDGSGDRTLYRFPHAVDAALSPTHEWIALREYHRSWLVRFRPEGSEEPVSPYERPASGIRIDAEDGGYLTWSADGETVGWTRGSGFYEKLVSDIVSNGGRSPDPAGDWTGARVPGSTARRTELAIDYPVATPEGTVALENARVITMNGAGDVLERATVLVTNGRIEAVGTDVDVPPGAERLDLRGTTIIPGLVDAHAHPHIEQSALHVIEQSPPYLRGPLAYGVTTMMEVYGNEYRDGWLTDMLQAGKMVGPRFLTTGSVIYGRRHGGRLRMFRPIETLDDAREQVRWNKDHGAVAVKDYAQATRKRRHLVATAAREMGLDVLSESSSDPQMNLTQILDGVTAIEHSMGLTPFYGDVVRFWQGTRASLTPTLLVVYNGPMGEGWFHQSDKLWEDAKLTRFVDPMSLQRIRQTTHLWPEDMYAWDMAGALRTFDAAGIPLQVGAHGQMFGLGYHWELQLYEQGGFTPSRVLELATIGGARKLGLEAQIGSIEVGKLADLVVLEQDPRESMENVQHIRGVMKNGWLFDGDAAAPVWPVRGDAPASYIRRPNQAAPLSERPVHDG